MTASAEVVTIETENPHPRTRWVTPRRQLWLATAVGALLRGAWIWWAAERPVGYSTDGATYLRMAGDLAHGRSPHIGDMPTAFFSPGYPTALAPFVRLGTATGLWDAWHAAMVFNLVCGTIAVTLVGELARRTLSPQAGSIAAWIYAVSPAAIYMSSHVMSENLFTPMLIGIAIGVVTVDHHLNPQLHAARQSASDAAKQGGVMPSGRWIFAVCLGGTIGLAGLVRSPGVAMLVVVGAVLSFSERGGRQRTWARLRFGLLTAVTAGVVLAPWTIRNAQQVGVATPFATNTATAFCVGNRDGADGTWKLTAAMLQDCFRHSPWDNPAIIEPENRPLGFEMTYPDETLWYQTTMSDTWRWIADNPTKQPRLIWNRAVATLLHDNDPQYVAYNEDGTYRGGEGTTRILGWIGNLWYWPVMATAIWGLVRSVDRRATLVVWLSAALLIAAPLIGVGYPQFRLPAMGFVVCLAAGAISTRSGLRRPQRSEQQIPRT